MFDILIERDFLVVVREACFRIKDKQARTWRITALPSGGKSATKDYMRWRAAPTDERSRNSFHGLTGETKDEKLTETVSPMRLTEPILVRSRSHQWDTYNIPSATTAKSRSLRGDALPTPLPVDWRPSGPTTRAANAAGLRYGDVFAAIEQFRAHHLASGELSDDWDAA